MADVLGTLRQWSSSPSTNQPKGTTAIGAGLDDNLRNIQAVVRQFLADQSTTVSPSAGIADLTTASGRWVPVTGSSTITGFGTEAAGIWYLVTLTGSPTINNGNISTPGGVTIVGQAGDMFVADSQGSGVWRLHSYTRVTPIPYPSVMMTEQASTSGTSVDFTGIPTWATKLHLSLNGVSTNGTSSLRIQLGDAGGIESTGYLGASARIQESSTTTAINGTSGADFADPSSAAVIRHGSIFITLVSPLNNTWAISGTIGHSDSTRMVILGYTKSTSAVLDRVRVTTVNGSDAFDAGSINVIYS